MRNHYVLPVSVAIAFHGALLFGVPKAPRPSVTQVERTVRELPLSPPPEEDPRVADDREPPAGPKSLPDAPVPPKGAEPPVILVDTGPTIAPPPLVQVNGRVLAGNFTDSLAQAGGKGNQLWTKVISSALLDNAPRTRFQATPMYPFQARRDGLRGEVVVDFLVDEHGRVVDPRVVSSTHRIFEDATLRAVAKWQFEPGRRDGKIVRFRMSAPFVFNLND